MRYRLCVLLITKINMININDNYDVNYPYGVDFEDIWVEEPIIKDNIDFN